ncbi:hypothetical protein BJ508DRAFT_315193 [Ascobolus immersus RN42]|uniref:Uncharacterized protein n=1 Tax=Ascobolus immersus RN42 TaxID=1160509 RepID=A0A3N4HFG6_ASCIM|nr:hypothetical protein BJ508DRAFT_315193 [Ascobolus immersus RN42]
MNSPVIYRATNLTQPAPGRLSRPVTPLVTSLDDLEAEEEASNMSEVASRVGFLVTRKTRRGTDSKPMTAFIIVSEDPKDEAYRIRALLGCAHSVLLRVIWTSKVIIGNDIIIKGEGEFACETCPELEDEASTEYGEASEGSVDCGRIFEEMREISKLRFPDMSE